MLPDYLRIPAAGLGKGTPVKVRILGDMAALARDLAQVMFDEIAAGEESGRGATLIVPVGPVDHWPLLAHMVNARKLSCRRAVFINMDEYLTYDGLCLPRPAEHTSELQSRLHLERPPLLGK